RERALALAPTLPLVPLYAQAMGLRLAPEVGGLTLDAQGLPALDGLFMLPPEGAAPGGRP
ncbi:peptide ABC transporter substrate-binding protein, partial [Pyxidicoccus sp. 3LG]